MTAFLGRVAGHSVGLQGSSWEDVARQSHQNQTNHCCGTAWRAMRHRTHLHHCLTRVEGVEAVGIRVAASLQAACFLAGSTWGFAAASSEAWDIPADHPQTDCSASGPSDERTSLGSAVGSKMVAVVADEEAVEAAEVAATTEQSWEVEADR